MSIYAPEHLSVSGMGGQAGSGVFSLETSGCCWAGEGVGREGEAWPELAASRFVPVSAWCQRCVSEQARGPCAAGMGDNCFFTCRVPAVSVGLQDPPNPPSSHRLALCCVPGAGAGCCRGCCGLYAARVSIVTGNLSGIMGGCSWDCGENHSK